MWDSAPKTEKLRAHIYTLIKLFFFQGENKTNVLQKKYYFSLSTLSF